MCHKLLDFHLIDLSYEAITAKMFNNYKLWSFTTLVTLNFLSLM